MCQLLYRRRQRQQQPWQHQQGGVQQVVHARYDDAPRCFSFHRI